MGHNYRHCIVPNKGGSNNQNKLKNCRFSGRTPKNDKSMRGECQMSRIRGVDRICTVTTYPVLVMDILSSSGAGPAQIISEKHFVKKVQNNIFQN